jgi:hypothetical protein
MSGERKRTASMLEDASAASPNKEPKVEAPKIVRFDSETQIKSITPESSLLSSGSISGEEILSQGAASEKQDSPMQASGSTSGEESLSQGAKAEERDSPTLEIVAPKRPRTGRLEEHTRSEQTRARIAKGKVVSQEQKDNRIAHESPQQRDARLWRFAKLQQLGSTPEESPLPKAALTEEKQTTLENLVNRDFANAKSLEDLRDVVKDNREILLELGKSELNINSSVMTIQIFIDAAKSPLTTVSKEIGQRLINITNVGNLRRRVWDLYNAAIIAKEALTVPAKPDGPAPSD